MVKQAFLSLKNRLKNSSFEAWKTLLLETVFESHKSLFDSGFYNVFIYCDFLSSLKSDSKVSNKELKRLFVELLEAHTKFFFNLKSSFLDAVAGSGNSLKHNKNHAV